jgi:hypothetical protein
MVELPREPVDPPFFPPPPFFELALAITQLLLNASCAKTAHSRNGSLR